MNRIERLTPRILTSLLCCALAGCGDAGSDEGSEGSEGGTEDPDTTAGETGTGACADPADANAPRMEITEAIDGDATWSCDTIWVVTDIVFVRNGTLTVEAGTTVQGASGGAVVIDQTARIEAVGTPEAPIVFTSALPEDMRNRGDWGGLVMLGRAPINVAGGVSSAEGFADPPPYGGDDPAHDCGTLQYVRSEWAGFEISAGSELNGVTFYACGTGTTVDHVQVHMGADDGFEMFGGGFDAKYLVVTGAADDAIDIDEGFTGLLQHVLIQQDPSVGDNCYEWSTQAVDFLAQPATTPTLVNATCIGSGPTGDKSKGFTLKEGTHTRVYNSIVTNITRAGVELLHQATQNAGTDGELVFQGVLFGDHSGFNVLINDDEPPDIQATWTDDDLAMTITAQAGNMDGVTIDGIVPTWGAVVAKPAAGSVADGSAQPVDAAGVDAATWIGAVDPNGADWTAEAWINYVP
jgi:hypothetical protein